MATFYTAQVTMQFASNLPRDVSENVFHFQGGASTAELSEAQQIVQRIADFYLGTTGSSDTVAQYLSSEINRLVDVRVYDAEAPERRPIFYEDSFTLPATSSLSTLPPEVALVLSYYGTRNEARQRGRVYIGPLTLVSEAASVSYAQPGPNLIGALVAAGARLATNTGSVHQAPTTLLPGTPATGPASVLWSVRSKYAALTGPTLGAMFTIINNGWVDNEWDGQRRRRIAATTRSAFGPS